MLALVACTVPSAAAPERIAIVGGGLAGLATAIHLLDGGAHGRTPRVLHIYDPSAPGCGGASAVAAGLLHPFTPRGREIWQGREGFAASCALLARCGEADGGGGGGGGVSGGGGGVSGVSGGGVSERTGLLRLALDDAQARGLRLRPGVVGLPSTTRRLIRRPRSRRLSLMLSPAVAIAVAVASTTRRLQP